MAQAHFNITSSYLAALSADKDLMYVKFSMHGLGIFKIKILPSYRKRTITKTTIGSNHQYIDE